MNQSLKPIKKVDQFLYLGRWVDKAHFCAFVYDKQGNEQLANNYQQFESLTSSGIWFASKPDIIPESKNVRDIKGKSYASLSNS